MNEPTREEILRRGYTTDPTQCPKCNHATLWSYELGDPDVETAYAFDQCANCGFENGVYEV